MAKYRSGDGPKKSLSGWAWRSNSASAPDMEQVADATTRMMRGGTMKGAQNFGSMPKQVLWVVGGLSAFVLLTMVLGPLQKRENYRHKTLVNEACRLVDQNVVYTAAFSFGLARELDSNFGDRNHFRVRVDVKHEDVDIGEGEVTFYPYRFRKRFSVENESSGLPNGDIEIRIPVGEAVTTDQLSCFPSMMAYG